mmetsp:Transcript_25374/g.21250  ORF Transcript_25374/g.21250 Transcript_25374/m.21250 type:complete len:93 (+) Transcript_25374:747-1025(+)
MLSGYSPFTGRNHKEIFMSIQNDPLHFNHFEFNYVTKEAKDLINQMLVKNPTKRIGISEILGHNFFSQKVNINLEKQFKEKMQIGREEKVNQ